MMYCASFSEERSHEGSYPSIRQELNPLLAREAAAGDGARSCLSPFRIDLPDETVRGISRELPRDRDRSPYASVVPTKCGPSRKPFWRERARAGE